MVPETNNAENSEILKKSFIELRANGKSISEISAELNQPVSKLITLSKTLQHDISNLKAVQMDSVGHKYKIIKVKRLEFLGNVLSKIQEELDTRDFKEVPTDKLFDFMLKYSIVLSKEYESPIFTEITHGIDPSAWETKINWTV